MLSNAATLSPIAVFGASFFLVVQYALSEPKLRIFALRGGGPATPPSASPKVASNDEGADRLNLPTLRKKV